MRLIGEETYGGRLLRTFEREAVNVESEEITTVNVGTIQGTGFLRVNGLAGQWIDMDDDHTYVRDIYHNLYKLVD